MPTTVGFFLWQDLNSCHPDSCPLISRFLHSTVTRLKVAAWCGVLPAIHTPRFSLSLLFSPYSMEHHVTVSVSSLSLTPSAAVRTQSKNTPQAGCTLMGRQQVDQVMFRKHLKLPRFQFSHRCGGNLKLFDHCHFKQKSLRPQLLRLLFDRNFFPSVICFISYLVQLYERNTTISTGRVKNEKLQEKN